MFLSTLYLWWLQLYYKTYKMMDYELNLDGWLEEVTLFANEPSDYSLNSDLLQNGKTNNEAARVTEFNDLPWFDEKVDLSLLDDPKSIQLSETELSELLSLIGSNSDNSYLSSEAPNSSFFDLNFDLNDIQDQVASPGSSTDFPFSPGYETISEASSPGGIALSPDYDAISVVNSPNSIASDAVDSALCCELSLSPENVTSIYSADESCQENVPAIYVTVCDADNETVSNQVTEALSIEEVSNSVRKRKFVNNGKEIPKVHVSLRNTFHPYSKATSKRGKDKSERKKVQNKEAAARYRIKKRIEEKELSVEVSGLEAEQEKLKTKHDDLENEIKYLKKLMREMLHKKGIL